MTFDEAFEIYKNKTKHSKDDVQKARLVLLQDVYEFLEDENRHLEIDVLQELTKIPFT